MKYIVLDKYVEESLAYKKELLELLNKTNINEKSKEEIYTFLIAYDNVLNYAASAKEMYKQKVEEYNELVDKVNNSYDRYVISEIKYKMREIKKEFEKLLASYKDLNELSSALFPIADDLKYKIESMAENNRSR